MFHILSNIPKFSPHNMGLSQAAGVTKDGLLRRFAPRNDDAFISRTSSGLSSFEAKRKGQEKFLKMVWRERDQPSSIPDYR
jgi:hypothetical protein